MPILRAREGSPKRIVTGFLPVWLPGKGREPYGALMPNKTGKNDHGPGPRYNAGPDYVTSRWEDAGPLISQGGKDFVRRATEKTSGREAVVKHVDPNRSRRHHRRFW